MLAESSPAPHDSSPIPLTAGPLPPRPTLSTSLIPTPTSTPTPTTGGRKRKQAPTASSSLAANADSPDPSATPNPTDTSVLSVHADLATRPRLTISRLPTFVPAPFQPSNDADAEPKYYLTDVLAINRLSYRYVPAGVASPDCVLPFRTIESNPTAYRVSWEDRSPFIRVTLDGLGLMGERGFRSTRGNAPVREGKWYLEMKIECGGGDPSAGGDKGKKEGCADGAHVRLGWARREAPLNAPAGLDGYSYGVRDKTGQKVHLSRPRPYGKPFRTGDVVGMYISLPPRPKEPEKGKGKESGKGTGKEKDGAKGKGGKGKGNADNEAWDEWDPRRLKRERIAIEFKGQEYWESLEYPQSKEMIALMDESNRDHSTAMASGDGSAPKTNGSSSTNSAVQPPLSSAPAPKKSATVKNLPRSSANPANSVSQNQTQNQNSSNSAAAASPTKRGGATAQAGVKDDEEGSRPIPTLGAESVIAFFVNGECQGIAYKDLFDFIPLRPTAEGIKKLIKERGRERRSGHREHRINTFDDGTLGYYPMISLFGGARVRINPGPDFEYMPPDDIDA